MSQPAPLHPGMAAREVMEQGYVTLALAAVEESRASGGGGGDGSGSRWAKETLKGRGGASLTLA